MIYHLIHSLNIYKNEDEFYQTALIALWEAKQRFDPEKGAFRSYAYAYMKGRMMTTLTKANKEEERNVYPNEEFWEMRVDEYRKQPLEQSILMAYCSHLTKRQKQWVLYTFYEGMTIKEIAKREQVSLSAVKKWRAGAKAKIRENIEAGLC